MSILRISKMGHPCLRSRAREIPDDQVQSEPVQRLIDDMVETMIDYQGIGLAAPQVFQSLRLLVVGSPEPAEALEDEASGGEDEVDRGIPLTIVVNPRVTDCSPDLVEDWEGCLSIPELHGRVPRHHSIQVEGLDRRGDAIQLHKSDYFSRVLQHEIDHLDGLLYVDRMTDLSSLCFTAEYQRYHLS